MNGLNTGNAKAALAERGDDLYETPAVATEALLRFEQLPEIVWEPACGPGSIVGTRDLYSKTYSSFTGSEPLGSSPFAHSCDAPDAT